mgnify:CR=1 FL=1
MTVALDMDFVRGQFPGLGGWAYLENAGGSMVPRAVIDRVAANMLRDAEERGAISEGQKLVEPTSGNTGLGLQMMANIKGYSLDTPISKLIPIEKRTMLRFFGSNVEELEDDL